MELEYTPPKAVEVEMSVLGACLMDENAMDTAIQRLKPDSFYDINHQSIYRVMLDIYTGGGRADLVTTITKLNDEGILDAIGGTDYLTGLVDSCSSLSNVQGWVSQLKEKQVARSLLKTSEEITQRIKDGHGIHKVLEDTERKLFQLGHHGSMKKVLPIGTLLNEALEELEHISKHESVGVTTGLKTLDKYYRFKPSNVVVLAARPSMGKTTLALQMAYEASKETGRPAVFFSAEMNNTGLVKRLVCQQAGVRITDLKHDSTRKEGWKKVVAMAGEISETGLIVDDTPGLTISQIRARLRQYVRRYNVCLAAIDYIQLLPCGVDMRGRNRESEVAYLSANMKIMAKEFNVPVLVLSQLNRRCEERVDKKPLLSDLRESGAIEQDADVVMLLTRHEFYFPTEELGLAQICIAKHRDGPTCQWQKIAFISDYPRFEDLSEEVEEEKQWYQKENF